MRAATLRAIERGDAPKGDVLGVARIAGIQAAKRTSALIPLCHPLALTHVDVECTPDRGLPGIRIAATVRCTGPTGAEMEALTAVAIAGLTLIDMAKGLDPWMALEGVLLQEKTGGKRGRLIRPVRTGGLGLTPADAPRASRRPGRAASE
jgi:cyclic pyranopterin phosphate synthase